MTEIELPCCDTIARVEILEDTIHCDHCGIDLEFAADEPTTGCAAA